MEIHGGEAEGAVYQLGQGAISQVIEPTADPNRSIMSEPSRLSPKSLQILKLIADGQSYSRIVDGNPELNYHDIFFAAEEAVWLHERIGTLSGTEESTLRPTELNSMERAKQNHPKAYAPWTASDDAELAAMHASGASKNEMAEHFQRQPSAIRSRLTKLGLA
jgi:hypothetical protein